MRMLGRSLLDTAQIQKEKVAQAQRQVMIYSRANAGHTDRGKQIRVDWHSLTNVREGAVGGVDRV